MKSTNTRFDRSKPSGCFPLDEARAEEVVKNSYLWAGLYPLALLGLTVRVVIALVSDNIYHPDELFQYLEQAHRAVFGYGFIPWEYRFGIRSWILPGFISMILMGCKLLGLGSPSFYIPVIKIVFSILATSLVFSAYVIAKELSTEKAGRLAAFSVCFWYEFVYFAHKPLPDMVSAYLLVAAFACLLSQGGRRKPILFGTLLAFCVVLRPQHLLPICLIIVLSLFLWQRNQLARAGLSFFLIVGLAGYIDFVTWGTPFISYYNNYLFNKVYNISSTFGTQRIHYYFVALTFSSAGIFLLSLILGVSNLRKTWIPLACISLVLLTHSMIPHKEYRFVFAVVPLVIIIVSMIAAENISIGLPPSIRCLFPLILVSGLICASGLGVFYRLPFQRLAYPFIVTLRDDNLRAYRLLANEQHLVAVYDGSRRWWLSGGYYYLHRNVPVYFDFHLQADAFDLGKLRRYVSHIVFPAQMDDPPGFESVATVGNLKVLKQVDGLEQLKQIDYYTRHLLNPLIDGKYTPNVTQRP